MVFEYLCGKMTITVFGSQKKKKLGIFEVSWNIQCFVQKIEFGKVTL